MPILGIILLGDEDLSAGGLLWEKEAQKVAAAFLFFCSASVLVHVAQSNAAVIFLLLSTSSTHKVSKYATVGSCSISNPRTVAIYKASMQLCEAKALDISHLCSLPQTSECGLKTALSL